MEKTNSKKMFVITLLILSGLLGVSLLAQENKDALKEKLKQLDGNIEKITVKVDGKDVVFEGEEVERISRPIKRLSRIPMLMEENGMDFLAGDGSKVVMRRIGPGGKLNWDEKEGDRKKVEIQIEDGKKKVTVTTEKDGKEEIKVLEGEEAEKFLKENRAGRRFNVFVEPGEEGSERMAFMRRAPRGCCCCDRPMERMMHWRGKDVKKIIIEKEVEKESE